MDQAIVYPQKQTPARSTCRCFLFYAVNAPGYWGNRFFKLKILAPGIAYFKRIDNLILHYTIHGLRYSRVSHLGSPVPPVNSYLAGSQVKRAWW